MADEKNEVSIDFNEEITDLFGKPIMQATGQDDEGKPIRQPLRLGEVVVNALMFNGEDEKVSGSDKLKRMSLAQKIVDGEDNYKSLPLTSEQKTLVKNAADKLYGTLVYAKTVELLDGFLPEE